MGFQGCATTYLLSFIVSSNLRRQSTVKLESNCHSDAVLLNYVECWQRRSAINSSCLIIVICLSERKTWKQRSVVKIIWWHWKKLCIAHLNVLWVIESMSTFSFETKLDDFSATSIALTKTVINDESENWYIWSILSRSTMKKQSSAARNATWRNASWWKWISADEIEAFSRRSAIFLWFSFGCIMRIHKLCIFDGWALYWTYSLEKCLFFSTGTLFLFVVNDIIKKLFF